VPELLDYIVHKMLAKPARGALSGRQELAQTWKVWRRQAGRP